MADQVSVYLIKHYGNSWIVKTTDKQLTLDYLLKDFSTCWYLACSLNDFFLYKEKGGFSDDIRSIDSQHEQKPSQRNLKLMKEWCQKKFESYQEEKTTFGYPLKELKKHLISQIEKDRFKIYDHNKLTQPELDITDFW